LSYPLVFSPDNTFAVHRADCRRRLPAALFA